MVTRNARRPGLNAAALATVTTLLVGVLSVASVPAPASAGSDGAVYGVTATWKAPTAKYSAVDESRGLLFVAPVSGRLVTTIDTVTGKKRATVALPQETGPMATSASAGLLYIAEPTMRRLLAVNASTGSIAFRVTIPGYRSSLVVDDSAGIVRVTNGNLGTVSAYDSRTGAPIDEPIPTGDYVHGIGVDESTHEVYASGDRSLVVIDGTDRTVTRTVPFTEQLGQVVVDSASHIAYVAGYYGYGVAVVTPETDFWILENSRAKSIALDPTTNDLLLLNAERGFMTRLLSVDRETGEAQHWVDTRYGDDFIVAPKSGTTYYTDEDAGQVTVFTKGQRPRILATPNTTGVRATVPYSTGPLETSGTKPLTWTLEGTTPSGIVINTRTGEVHGAFEKKGHYSVVARATNRFGFDEIVLDVSVDVPPQGAPKLRALTAAHAPKHHQSYFASLGLTGYPAPKLTSKKLPEGIRLSQDGSVSGTLKNVGKQSFTVTATNKYGSVSRKYTLAVTGVGRKTGGVFIVGKETKLDGLDRKWIREPVRSMPKNAVVTSVEIIGGADIVHGDKAAAIKKAKKRAYAIASYLDHLGVTVQPKYSTSTGVPKNGQHYYSSDFSIRYTYK